MNYSPACVALVKSFEGCRLVGYPDVRGIPTVGYGHTGPEVKIGELRCEMTGNLCGSDTRMAGHPCPCDACQRYLESLPQHPNFPLRGQVVIS